MKRGGPGKGGSQDPLTPPPPLDTPMEYAILSYRSVDILYPVLLVGI